MYFAIWKELSRLHHKYNNEDAELYRFDFFWDEDRKNIDRQSKSSLI